MNKDQLLALAPDTRVNHDLPGARLREARQARGWSAREVADRLHLLESRVLDLENNVYQRFPGDVYVTGSLRNYARELQLNGDDIIREYRQRQTALAVQAQAAAAAAAEESHEKPRQGGIVQQAHLLREKSLLAPYAQNRVVWGLAVVAMIGLGMWLNSADKLPDAQKASPELNMVKVDTAKGTTIIGPFAEFESELIEVTPGNDNAEESSVERRQTADTLAEQQRTEDPAQHDSRLAFYFTGDCWVEVVDGEQKLIYASLMRADQALELEGTPPFQVKLGYAPAVSLSYNGQPVEITTNRSNNTAKLTLGNS